MKQKRVFPPKQTTVSQAMPPDQGRRYLDWVKEKAFAPNFGMPKQ